MLVIVYTITYARLRISLKFVFASIKILLCIFVELTGQIIFSKLFFIGWFICCEQVVLFNLLVDLL
jgi:hypothetical protein